MSLPWFRMYAEFAGDPVIQSLAFEDQRHYVIILCLKCDGVLDRKISKEARNRIINRALGLDCATADEVKRRLVETNLVTETWQPVGWTKRQYKSDNSTERVRNYRKRKDRGNVTETPGKRSGNAPDTDTDTEEKTKAKKRFTPPSVEQVRDYCQQRGNRVDPERFVNYYTANGWKVGRNPMKDWKAAIRTWERNQPKQETYDPTEDYL